MEDKERIKLMTLYNEQITILEELIDEFGINRSLGNVLDTIKARKKYWMEHP